MSSGFCSSSRDGGSKVGRGMRSGMGTITERCWGTACRAGRERGLWEVKWMYMGPYGDTYLGFPAQSHLRECNL